MLLVWPLTVSAFWAPEMAFLLGVVLLWFVASLAFGLVHRLRRAPSALPSPVTWGLRVGAVFSLSVALLWTFRGLDERRARRVASVVRAACVEDGACPRRLEDLVPERLDSVPRSPLGMIWTDPMTLSCTTDATHLGRDRTCHVQYRSEREWHYEIDVFTGVRR